MAEKFTRQLPVVRCGEALETALMRLASEDDRVLSDYIRRVLSLHCFGHVSNGADDCECCGESIALQSNARSRGPRK
jgi:hypothetical protein